MSRFLEQLRAGIEACRLQGVPVVLGVSGGADSVAMLRGLVNLKHDLRLELCVGHLNHNLRGDQSRQDADWLADLCAQMNVRCFVGAEDVAQAAKSTGKGIEETAREIRYSFLEEIAKRHGFNHIAVAHTVDDQAETILHHVIRGTGIAGLRGMRRSRKLGSGITLTRPLLAITRQQVEAYLAELNQGFRLDISNVDEDFTRNRIRHKLLPMLADQFNPQVRDALIRLGRQADGIQQTLELLAQSILQDAVEDQTGDTCRINCDVLAVQPRHLIRECMTFLWTQLNWPRQRMGFEDWDRLADLVLDGGTCTFPGNVEARRRGTLLVLRRL